MIDDATTIWELTSEDVELLFRWRHLNNYVYAGIHVVRGSTLPKGHLTIASGLLSATTTARVNELLELSPALDHAEGQRRTRIAIARRMFLLYRDLDTLQDADIERATRALAALAYLPLVSEVRDNYPLWWHRPVRAIEPRHRRQFPFLLRPFRYEDAWRMFAADLAWRKVSPERPLSLLYGITLELVSTVLVQIENGIEPELARTAFHHLADAMREFEAQVREARAFWTSIRYRNTLYLYGGNHIERTGRHAEALDWYLEGLGAIRPEMLGNSGFYLTSLKVYERLLCAYRVGSDGERRRLLPVIQAVLAASFRQAGDYSDKVLRSMDRHPEQDWGKPKVQVDGHELLGCGEATREPLLAALLYRWIIEGVHPRETDYSVLLPAGIVAASSSTLSQ